MRGSIAEVPVFNVSIPVTGRDFVVFDLSATSLASLAIIVAVTLWSAVRAVEEREYVLDQ